LIGDQKIATWLALKVLTPKKMRVSDTILFNWETVDFSDRSVILSLGATLEDLGVAAVNGAMISSVTNPTDLGLLAKISTNWARHAAVVNDFNDLDATGPTGPRTRFVHVVDSQGLDVSSTPSDVVTTIAPYFVSKLSLGGA